MPKKINEADVFKSVIKLLVDRGYDRATTSEMAAASNMHEATLFRKYGSKDGLIEQAFNHLLSTTPLSKVTYTGDLQADLFAILDAYVATYNQYGEIMPMVLLEIPRNPELRKVLLTPLANINGLVSIITRYQNEGGLRKESPITSVNVLLAPILLNQMLSRANTDLPAPSIDLHDYVEAFLNGRKLLSNDGAKGLNSN